CNGPLAKMPRRRGTVFEYRTVLRSNTLPIGTSLNLRIGGSPADCRPRHAIDPGQPDILQPCRLHECYDLIASPIMRYVREHLVEDDRAQMSEAESCCKPEVFRGSKFELQQDPQQRGGVKR